MNAALDRRVRRRANQCCEYCKLPQSAYKFRFPVDHIIAQQHGGKTILGNLCLACPRCNASKGPNVASIDSETGKIVSLFNPRRHKWHAHFRWVGPVMQGKTAIGRATVAILAINHPTAIAVRQSLIEEGLFPPPDGAILR